MKKDLPGSRRYIRIGHDWRQFRSSLLMVASLMPIPPSLICGNWRLMRGWSIFLMIRASVPTVWCGTASRWALMKEKMGSISCIRRLPGR